MGRSSLPATNGRAEGTQNTTPSAKLKCSFLFSSASPRPPAQTTNPSMRAFPLLLLVSLSLIAIASGYQWEPVHSDSFPWRPCSSFEATKKNCPKGEPCMADLSYAGYVPNNALKCQRSRDRLLEQYQNAKIG